MEGLLKKICIFAVLFLLSSAAEAATLNVGPGQQYTKIQSAIDAAKSGDLIIVNEGTYFEHVKISKNGLTLKGSNKDKTILDGGDLGVAVILLEKANNVKISDLTIKRSGGSSYRDAGITLLSSSNNEITGINSSDNYIGISLYQFSNNNTIRYNSANSNNNYGIFLFQSMDNIVNNNNALNNKIGFYLDSSRSNRLYSNNIAGNNNTAFDNSGLNSWDDGGTGNYWDDYSGTGPYPISGLNAKDNYPLRNPVSIPGQPPVSAVVSPKAGKPTPGFSAILFAAGLFTAYLITRRLKS